MLTCRTNHSGERFRSSRLSLVRSVDCLELHRPSCPRRRVLKRLPQASRCETAGSCSVELARYSRFAKLQLYVGTGKAKRFVPFRRGKPAALIRYLPGGQSLQLLAALPFEVQGICTRSAHHNGKRPVGRRSAGDIIAQSRRRMRAKWSQW